MSSASDVGDKTVDVLSPNFQKRGGVCVVIAQDVHSGRILMQGYVDEAGYRETLLTGEAVYYSTSRHQRWKKGETSGAVQIVHEILIDCDGDAIIYLVEQKGEGACHTGALSCFYRTFLGHRLTEEVQDGDAERLSSIPLPVCKRLISPPDDCSCSSGCCSHS